MTLGWLVTAEDGKPWNWCLRTTGGHRCQGVTTSIGSDLSVVTKDSRLLKTFDFQDSKECLGFYSKVLS